LWDPPCTRLLAARRCRPGRVSPPTKSSHNGFIEHKVLRVLFTSANCRPLTGVVSASACDAAQHNFWAEHWYGT
jgi:hypothetical protein